MKTTLPEIKHILIAEDDQDDIDFFKEAIKDNCPEIELTVAQDGKRLLSVLDKIETPDVIVLDLNMPFINGKDCLKAIRQNDKFEHVPIVVYSTSSNQYDVDFCLKNGANHYVVKPGTYTAISNLVHKLCNGTLTAA
jgi:CheY-like chemotaxis protein